MRQVLIGIYFISLLVHIVLGELGLSSTLAIVLKGSLMPLLLLYTSLFAPKSDLKKYVWIGLFLSWVGDLFLAFDDENPIFFIFGLASFLLAHLSYIVGFIKDAPIVFPIRMNAKQWGLVLLTLLFAIAYFMFLQPSLRDMTIPVIAYIIAIASMAIFAVHRKSKTNSMSYLFILAGAFLFVASDSLLAYNKFIAPLPSSVVLIMMTYGLAQLCISIGTDKNEKH